MLYTHKIATLNINGITSPLKLQLLNNLLLRQDVDVALLQEITTDDFSPLYNYTAYVNEGLDKRGTAILTRQGLYMKNIKRLPSGRGIAGQFKDTYIINVYAPSGAEKRREREDFFTREMAYLLPTNLEDVILAGDFNCVTSQADCTGTPNGSKALTEITTNLALHDVYNTRIQKPPYTHYTTKSATRIDRIYLTGNLQKRKQGADTIIAPFTDHSAVVVRLTYQYQNIPQKTRQWRMNISMLDDGDFYDVMKRLWIRWKMNTRHYPNKTSWWDRYIKKRIKQTFIREGTARNKERRDMEEFYYTAIYHAIRSTPNTENLAINIRRLKAKILQLTSQTMRGVILDTSENDYMKGEEITTYQYIKSRKRQQKRQIMKILDEQGNLQTDNEVIMKQFVDFLTKKYSPLPSDTNSFQKMTSCGMEKIPDTENTILENPITMEELKETVKKGKRKKSPGPDGINHEFFIKEWDIIKEDLKDIINDMYINGSISDAQKHGHIVCLPKNTNSMSPDNFRPLTLLNTDYKILTRIIANRLKPRADNILHRNQFCGRSGHTILDAIATVRDIIAYAEEYNESICLLSIDFKDAFDKISHTYLFKILQEYGISDRFCSRLKKIYANATSTLTLNGHRSPTIQIESGVRQGCPLSMLLFALCINPLLTTLDKNLQGVYIRNKRIKMTAIAYADDVTIFVTKQEEIVTIEETLRDYMLATGAQININKSKALAIGSWNKNIPMMNISYKDDITILGIQFMKKTQQSTEKSWTTLTTKLRAQVQKDYNRALNLENRIRYVNNYLLARVWYMTQIFPPPTNQARQITTAMSWFIWKGEIFRVPLTTLYRPKEHGGRALTNVTAKCMTLFMTRMEKQMEMDDTITADWLKKWNLHKKTPNPPDEGMIPRKYDYLHRYKIEAAYTPIRGTHENQRSFKTRLYKVILTSINAAVSPQEMRIQKLWPNIDWPNTWKNLKEAPISDDTRCLWYRVIHDIIPTNCRLHRIQMTPSDTCRWCPESDTLEHRIISCRQGVQIWNHTKTLIARMMRIDPKHIPNDWPLRPYFKIWPPQKHKAILWTLANTVTFRTKHHPDLTLQDYIDFLKRTRWKLMRSKRGRTLVGNYLTVLDATRKTR
jgi:exonuclease III